jgi:hypothetical protein
LETAENSSIIIIPECKRSHSGKYSITAKNKAGQKTANCRVKVMGKKNFKSYYKIKKMAGGRGEKWPKQCMCI